MAKNPKLVRERKVSILNPHKVEYYIKNPNTKTVTAKTFGHLALTKRIIGHALDRIRKHGIALVEWDSIEIDIDPAEAGKSNVTLDVHFINDGKVHPRLTRFWKSIQFMRKWELLSNCSSTQVLILTAN